MASKRPPPYRMRQSKPGPAHPFWTTSDVVGHMLTFFSLVQLVKFSHISRACQQHATTLIKGRITRYTNPFFTYTIARPPPLSLENSTLFTRFFQVLESTRSWIVGSVPLAAASVLSDPPCPDNLNIITSCSEVGNWLDFLVHESGFSTHDRYWSTGPYATSGHLGYKVTITATPAAHFGPLFFSAPNTDQLIAIAAYELITPVLLNVSEQQHLKAWRPTIHRHFILPNLPANPLYRTQPRFQGVTTLDDSTAAWTRPCGMSCPGVWRKARGLKGIAHIKWGGLDDLGDFTDPALVDLGRSRFTFRFGIMCDNPRCVHSDSYIPVQDA
ncbi:hypothetical protein B0H13DRAFT_2329494 [Mycena leptocephala]|nr:hypothetical protein B0H13DRAFT_2329494 [Mycena leptocephala]